MLREVCCDILNLHRPANKTEVSKVCCGDSRERERAIEMGNIGGICRGLVDHSVSESACFDKDLVCIILTAVNVTLMKITATPQGL